MSQSIQSFVEAVAKKNPNEPEFMQAVHEVAETVIPFIEENKKSSSKVLDTQIARQINDILSDAIEASEFNPAITPDTMILPTSLMRILTQRRIADNLETTIFAEKKCRNNYHRENP
jgi:hypothetical protein